MEYGDNLSNIENCVNAKIGYDNDEKGLKDFNLKNPVLKIPNKNNYKKYLKWIPFPDNYYNIFGDADFSNINLEEFDLVHMHNPIPLYAMNHLSKLCLKKNIPYVITTHGTNILINYPIELNMNVFLKIIYNNFFLKKYFSILRNASALFSLSKKGSQRLKQLFPNQHIFETSNGVNFEDFKISEKEKMNTIKKFDISLNKINMLYVGPISKRKGVHILLDAIKDLDEDFDLYLVGSMFDEELERKIYSFCEKDSRVKYLGYVDKNDLISLYHLSKIFVLPSLVEMSPLCIREAMITGNVVITTDIEGNNELVKDGENGFLFPLGNSDELKRIIKKNLNYEEIIEKLARNGKIQGIKEFNWHHIANKNREHYKKILRSNTQ